LIITSPHITVDNAATSIICCCSMIYMIVRNSGTGLTLMLCCKLAVRKPVLLLWQWAVRGQRLFTDFLYEERTLKGLLRLARRWWRSKKRTQNHLSYPAAQRLF